MVPRRDGAANYENVYIATTPSRLGRIDAGAVPRLDVNVRDAHIDVAITRPILYGINPLGRGVSIRRDGAITYLDDDVARALMAGSDGVGCKAVGRDDDVLDVNEQRAIGIEKAIDALIVARNINLAPVHLDGHIARSAGAGAVQDFPGDAGLCGRGDVDVVDVDNDVFGLARAVEDTMDRVTERGVVAV